MPQASYKSETHIVRSVASNPSCRWIWTKHVVQQMREREINASDVKHALTNCHVELVERKKDDVWRVKGFDLDGKTIGIACVVFEDSIAIRIVTAF